MRSIKRIFVHCTAGSQKQTIEDLKKEFKNKGWKNPGYHYVVMPDGTIKQMLGEEKVSNGVQGYNSTSVNVAYVGGIDSNGKAVDNRTEPQKASLVKLLRSCGAVIRMLRYLVTGISALTPIITARLTHGRG